MESQPGRRLASYLQDSTLRSFPSFSTRSLTELLLLTSPTPSYGPWGGGRGELSEETRHRERKIDSKKGAEGAEDPDQSRPGKALWG